MGDPRDEFYPPRWYDLSEAEREERIESDCEEAEIQSDRLYRSPLADLILTACKERTAELEAVAVKMKNLVDAVQALEQAERDIDESNPLANFCLRLDDSFGDTAEQTLAELNGVISDLALIAETLTNARKD